MISPDTNDVAPCKRLKLKVVLIGEVNAGTPMLLQLLSLTLYFTQCLIVTGLTCIPVQRVIKQQNVCCLERSLACLGTYAFSTLSKYTSAEEVFGLVKWFRPGS